MVARLPLPCLASYLNVRLSREMKWGEGGWKKKRKILGEGRKRELRGYCGHIYADTFGSYVSHCVCVFVCVYVFERKRDRERTERTRTHILLSVPL